MADPIVSADHPPGAGKGALAVLFFLHAAAMAAYTVPLANVLDWACPQLLAVMVVPGVGHFFHGQLPLLKSLVVRHWS